MEPRVRANPTSLLLLGLLSLPGAQSMVIQRVHGMADSEIAFASSGGGTHMYLTGTDLGSAFAPPSVYIGSRAQIECNVQSFTSSDNRLHCIIAADSLPAPTPDYAPTGNFVSLPIRVVKADGQIAHCWHVGGINHGCFARFDTGGTPRVLRVLTSTVESGGTLRVSGQGIDGELRGAQRLAATLFRGATPVLGKCGEKDCQASSVGAETLNCASRPDSNGDGVFGLTQNALQALSFSDDTHFGCVLDGLDGGLVGGFFNLSLHAISDEHHRGDSYLGFLHTRLVDIETGEPFDAEAPPRITAVGPASGSLAGGAELTISGTGAM